MLKREDAYQPWSVLESNEQVPLSGRGFFQARIEHAYQFTLGSIYNRSGYHVLPRRQFNLVGPLRDPAVNVMSVATDQFGVWNVSGYPLSVFLVLRNTSALPNVTSERVQRAPIDGSCMPTELGLVQPARFGAVLTSNLGHKEADVYTEKDNEAVLLVATFNNGTARLWATPSVERGTCLVLLPECIEDKSPTASQRCAENTFQSTILALYAQETRGRRRDEPL